MSWKLRQEYLILETCTEAKDSHRVVLWLFVFKDMLAQVLEVEIDYRYTH